MYSNDIEELLTNITTLRDTIIDQILELSKKIRYRIYNEEHVHAMNNPVYVGNGYGLGLGTTEIFQTRESEVGPDYNTLEASTYINPVQDAYENVEEDELNLGSIENELFKDKSEITNSYGSPWTEYDNLDKVMEEILNFKDQYSTMRYINEKRTLMDLFQLAVTCCNDCKNSILYYYNILTAGYDDIFNDGEESIQHEFNTIENKENKKGSNFFKKKEEDPYQKA